MDWWVWLESRPRAGGISCPFLNPFLVDFFDPYFFQSPGTPPLGGSRPAPSDLKKRPGVHAYGPTFGDSPGGWRFLSPARWYSSVGIRKWGGGCVMRDGRVPLARPGGASIYGELFEDETYDGRAGSRPDPHPPASLGHAGSETQTHRPDAHT